MVLVDFSSLNTRVALVAKDAPDFIIEQAVYDSVQTFLIRTETWQTVAEVDASKGDEELSVSALPGTAIQRVVNLSLDGEVIPAVTEDQMHRRPSGVFGRPQSFAQMDDQLLIVTPTPDVSLTGTARLVLRLAATGTKLPAELLSMYRQTLIDGALSIVLMSSAEFGDQRLASHYEQRFAAGIEAAKARAYREKTNTVHLATYGGY